MRGDLVPLAYLLDHRVGIVFIVDNHYDLWVAEVCIWALHHVIKELSLKLSGITFPLKLYVGRILNLDMQHTARVFEGLYDLVSDITVAPATMPSLLEDDHPILICQVNCLLDRQSSQDLLIDMDNLVILENLGRAEHCGLDLGRCRLKLDAPFRHRSLLGQAVEHLLDTLHAVSWRQFGLHQGVSHARALFDMVGYTVHDCKFRRKIQKVIAHLNYKKWLSEISDLQVVLLIEVLSDAFLSPVEGELKLSHTLLKVNVVNDVGALGAPVSNDALTIELKLYCLLELVLTVSSTLQLVYLFEACRGRHELEDAVDGERAAHLCLEG